MLFNSIDFAIFLPIVFLLYWSLSNANLKFQNLLVIAASYLFYGWWDWRFLFLIILSSSVDFLIGVNLAKETKPNRRKILLWASILLNLGLLGFFKYFNFFLDNFVQAFSFFGTTLEVNSLEIILPVGISFYTFQTMSYTLDIYREKMKPTKDFVAFCAFVSFFPQLVAGPIERASQLLPQFHKKRTFVYANATDGLRQMLWGLFKKVVIADNCAIFANEIFNNSSNYSGSTLAIGALFFAFQIYGDFSGYSDIAIGTSRLFGINLRQNFNFPYFSRDIAEFWRRWHISLSTWFRDYLYIPLGGSRGSKFSKIRNIFIIFMVSGFWHGANWTFLIWGFINALFFIPLMLNDNNRSNLDTVAFGSNFPSFRELFNMMKTFTIITFAWIFFRANNLTHAKDYILEIFSGSMFEIPNFPNMLGAVEAIAFILLFVIIEWIGRNNQYAIEKIGFQWNRSIRFCLYYIFIGLIFYSSLGKGEQDFIYFQF